MLLNWLEVLKNNKVIRHIKFKKGLNLILDKAESKSGGNSIGKSTFGRVIDYMFLAKPDDIYLDPEFKKPNPFVYSLLEKNDVVIRLSFTSDSSKEIIFTRNLPVGEAERTFEISGETVPENEYTNTLLRLIFGNPESKPSIRNIAPKFVRNSHEKMQNTLSFLDVRTPQSVYNHVFPFLFGFTKMKIITDKTELDRNIKGLSKRLAAYRANHSEGPLQRMLKPIEKELSELQKKMANLDIIGEAGKDIKNLLEIQGLISDHSVEVSKKKLTKDAQDNSIKELRSQMTAFDVREIENIYKYALASLPLVHKKFEDVIHFHNMLIEKKVKFISEASDSIVSEIDELEKKILVLEKKEAAILDRIKQPDVMETLIGIQRQISRLSERKGEIEGIIRAIKETKDDLEKKNSELDKIKKELVSYQEILDKNIEKFNEFFSSFSKKLYGENYIFSLDFNPDTGQCNYSIDSISPNPEGGKKKGEISAFDLAYIKFVAETKLTRPKFVLHDSIEDVDHIQINRIFEIANEIDGQYVVSMLRDKLVEIPQEMITECTILELAEEEKFFLV